MRQRTSSRREQRKRRKGEHPGVGGKRSEEDEVQYRWEVGKADLSWGNNKITKKRIRIHLHVYIYGHIIYMGKYQANPDIYVYIQIYRYTDIYIYIYIYIRGGRGIVPGG